jgi:hypothetical protein
MTTTVVKTIGAGGDFTTLQSWHDGAPANLVTADQVWQGQMKAASDNLSGSSGTLLLLAANTTDATRYMELTTATGASFKDNANVQTNALQWNSSNGCSITNSGSYGVTINASAQSFFRISYQQVQATTSKTTCFIAGPNSDINGCIFESAHNLTVNIEDANTKIRNCLVVLRITASTACSKLGYGPTAINCTFVTPSDLTKPSEVIQGAGGASSPMKNCAMFWGTALQSGGTAPTYTTSGNDNASPPSGVTQFTYDTSLFQNITNATRDYRIPSGSGLIGAGTVDNTNAPVDIAGTTRGASNDIGCWQFVSSNVLMAQACL